MGPIEVPGLASKAGVALHLLSDFPNASAEPSLLGGIPGAGAETSSSSQMEGLNKSCMNTTRRGGSQLNLS
jgi:hypothetical protein